MCTPVIRRAELADRESVAGLALLLWPDNEPEELIEEFTELLSSAECAVFLCYADSQPVGFAQCQLRRDYVEGTDTSPVGYLEGIFVMESHRNCGLARELLHACEAWSQSMGCCEFASDCELDNETSLLFHLRMGFIEANRIICFTKQLTKE